MNVVPLDPAPGRGSHGRLPDAPQDGPVLLCSDPRDPAKDKLAATDVHNLLLGLQGIKPLVETLKS
jgi:hypothetical protein